MTEKCEVFEKAQGKFAASLQREIDSLECNLGDAKQTAVGLKRRIAMLQRVYEAIIDCGKDESMEESDLNCQLNRSASKLSVAICEQLNGWMTLREIVMAVNADQSQVHKCLKDLIASKKVQRRRNYQRRGKLIEYRLV